MANFARTLNERVAEGVAYEVHDFGPQEFFIQPIFDKGAFNNYVDRILPFLAPPPLRGQFLYPERGQKQTFLTPSPPPDPRQEKRAVK